MPTVFIVGCGDIGRQVAAIWQEKRGQVLALARSVDSVDALSRRGIKPVAGDLDRPESLHGLPTADALLYYFAPPRGSGDCDLRMRALLGALTAENRPNRIVYISTSGVYGDCRGAWVDEEAPPRPATARARRRADAEQQLLGWSDSTHVPVVILRVGGIYGPGRLPLERLREGLPVLRPEESLYTNRIHSHDLVRACVAAGERPQAQGIINIADDHPGTMTEYFFAVADHFGIPRPPAISLEEARQVLSPAMLSYLTESRRMRTRRMRDVLGVIPRYPDLASGLAAAEELPEAAS